MKKINIEIGFKNLKQFGVLVLIFFVLTAFFTFITMFILVQTEDTVVVPDVRSLNVLDAAERLQSAGLSFYVSMNSSKDYPKFTVISQGVEPGESVKKERKIMLLVSAGSDFVEIPNFIDKNIKLVESIVKDSKIYIDKIEFANSPKPLGTIIDQFPKAGTFSSDVIGLRFVISNGRKDFNIDLNGLYEKEAILMTQSLGLYPLVEYKNIDDPKKDGRVISFEIIRTSVDIIKIIVGRIPGNEFKTVNIPVTEDIDRKILRLVCYDNRGKTILFEGRGYKGEDIIETFKPYGTPRVYLYTVENNEEKFYKEINF